MPVITCHPSFIGRSEHGVQGYPLVCSHDFQGAEEGRYIGGQIPSPVELPRYRVRGNAKHMSQLVLREAKGFQSGAVRSFVAHAGPSHRAIDQRNVDYDIAQRIDVAYNPVWLTGSDFVMPRKPSPEDNFAVDHPDLIVQWHPSRNGTLTPADFLSGSSKKVWWQCPQGHEYHRPPHYHRKFNGRCPICTGAKIVFVNSFLGMHPDLSKLFHPTKNDGIDLSKIAPGSEVDCWWLCSEGHEYIRKPAVQAKSGGRCPECARFAVKHPHLVKMWHPTRNDTPSIPDIGAASHISVWWMCPLGHEYKRAPCNQTKYDGRCPFCTGKRVRSDSSLSAKHPIVSAQWHSKRNGDLSPEDVHPKSNKRVWWLCPRGHEYEMLIHHRSTGLGCPHCNPKTSKMEIFVYSEIAKIFPEALWRAKVDGAEADIFLPAINVVIEVDGSYWHLKKISRDVKKTEKFIKLGLSVFRVRGYGLPKLSDTDIFFREGKQDVSVIMALLKTIANRTSLTKRQKLDIAAYCDRGVRQNSTLYEKMLHSVSDPSVKSPVRSQNYSIGAGSQYNLNLGL